MLLFHPCEINSIIFILHDDKCKQKKKNDCFHFLLMIHDLLEVLFKYCQSSAFSSSVNRNVEEFKHIISSLFCCNYPHLLQLCPLLPSTIDSMIIIQLFSISFSKNKKHTFALLLEIHFSRGKQLETIRNYKLWFNNNSKFI